MGSGKSFFFGCCGVEDQQTVLFFLIVRLFTSALLVLVSFGVVFGWLSVGQCSSLFPGCLMLLSVNLFFSQTVW